MKRPYITFTLADEEFGIPVDDTREVAELSAIHRLPELPDFLHGVMQLRGHSVLVMDLRKRFGLATHTRPHTARVLIIKVQEMVLGLVVDRVNGVLEIDFCNVDTTEKLGAGHFSAGTVTGIFQMEERMIFLLSPAKLLNPEEQGRLTQMTPMAGPMAG
ncbi:MAG: purine-binding chemotaxis protein CheW [Deltaproteobacteria bacterium]|nr:purine-binding chemotaxis protein CheW [Deltaproteobacteria bacterium]